MKVFSDNDLNERELRGNYQDKLTEQAIMLRASTRKVAEDILSPA
jgi:hypothetical protein